MQQVYYLLFSSWLPASFFPQGKWKWEVDTQATKFLGDWMNYRLSSGFSTVVLWPTASASPGNSLEMQILRAHPRPTESEIQKGVIVVHTKAWETQP